MEANCQILNENFDPVSDQKIKNAPKYTRNQKDNI